jgi:hypothetical protein
MQILLYESNLTLCILVFDQNAIFFLYINQLIFYFVKKKKKLIGSGSNQTNLKFDFEWKLIRFGYYVDFKFITTRNSTDFCIIERVSNLKNCGCCFGYEIFRFYPI